MPKRFDDMVQRRSTERPPKIEKVNVRVRPLEEPARPVIREKEKISRQAPATEREESRSSGPRYRVWAVATIAIVLFLFALSFLFSKAFVTISPKMQDVTLAEHLSATKDSATDNLSYDLVVISGEETKKIKAGDEKDVAVKSRGVVIIYNNFSAASQSLDIDTRLEGSNGKIYKTEKKIVVPGVVAGKPGSIEVGIYAAESGAEYNSAPLDFKILGFKGTPKYDKFYGRGKGATTGGLKGVIPVVSDADKTAAMTELRTTLQTKLQKKATDQIPKGFVLFKGAVFLSTGEPTVDYDASADGMVPISVKGTLYGFIFDENKLTKQIAKDEIDSYDNAPVYVYNIKDLTFSLTNKDNISYADVKNIDFTLSGKTKIVWKFDEPKFLTDILGTPKKEFNQTLAKYTNVSTAELHLRPFWRTTLPGDVKDIALTINYPK